MRNCAQVAFPYQLCVDDSNPAAFECIADRFYLKKSVRCPCDAKKIQIVILFKYLHSANVFVCAFSLFCLVNISLQEIQSCRSP
jgi:hypothetical protein